MRLSRIAAATFCLSLASTTTLFATDGVIEINQARALAGGVTAGDTAGYPVTISVSGSYRLTGNLSIASKDTTAISVTAANVTIDLNGFMIAGPNTCSAGSPTTCTLAGSGVGISASVNNVTVRNGIIMGMGSNGLDAGTSARVENMHISQNGGTGISDAFPNSVFVGCLVDVNGSFGILTSGTNNLILNCVTTSNASTGITAGGSGCLVSNCISRGNGTGISAASNCLITGSTATGNTSFGLSAGASSAYGNCLFAANNGANPDVSGGIQIATNICNGTTTCP